MSYQATNSTMLRRNLWRITPAPRRCHWCKCNLTYASATLEHITPIARGGTSQWDNLALACEACNTTRHKPEGKA